MAGDPPQLIACEAFLGLARICYQWNDLDTAQQHGQQCVQLTQQKESIDTFASYEVFLARLRLAQGDSAGATAALNEAEAYIQQHNFMFRMPDVVAAQVITLLRQGNLGQRLIWPRSMNSPSARRGFTWRRADTSATLALLEPLRQQMEAKGWQDERLKIMILQAVALQAHGDLDQAVQLLGEALALAAPGGFIRIFVDEGLPMAQLLSETAVRGIMPDYCGQLLAVFEAEGQKVKIESHPPPAQPLTDPLTKRELEILRLINAGTEKQRDRRTIGYQPQYRPLPHQKHLQQTGRQQTHSSHCQSKRKPSYLNFLQLFPAKPQFLSPIPQFPVGMNRANCAILNACRTKTPQAEQLPHQNQRVFRCPLARLVRWFNHHPDRRWRHHFKRCHR